MAGSWTYDESDNKVVMTGGTSGTPARLSDFVTADRAGYAQLTPEDAPVAINADPTSFSLTYQPRPVEDLAIRLKITASADVGGATLDIDGDDWQGNHQDDDGIDISGAATTPVVTTTYWSAIDANGITVHGIDDGTTIKIEQEYWGVIWDYGDGQYKIDSHFTMGDGSTSTYFKILEEHIAFDTDCLFQSTANAVFHAGTEYTTGGYSEAFSSIMQTFSNYGSQFFSGKSLIYGLHWLAKGGTYLTLRFNGADTEIYDIFFEGFYQWYLAGATSTIKRAKAANMGNTFACNATDATVDSLNLWDFVGAGLVTESGCTVSNTTVGKKNWVGGGVWLNISSATKRTVNCVNVINNSQLDWDAMTMNSGSSSEVYRKYTVDIHVADKDGSNLSGATVLCEDTNDNQIFSVSTAADGTITQQQVSSHLYYESGGGTISTTTYGPHKFTISKAGYKTLILDAITISDEIDWHLELQDIDVNEMQEETFLIDTARTYLDD